MTTLFKMANIQVDSDNYLAALDLGYPVIRDAVRQYVDFVMQDSRNVLNTFVESRTTDYQEKYKLPMTGEMSKVRPATIKPPVTVSGGWTVAYPLHEFSDDFQLTDVNWAYMTVGGFQAHVDGIISRYFTRLYKEALRVIFNNTSQTFTDEQRGALTIQPLANTDGTLYPPGPYGSAVTERECYAESNTTSISTVNNPFPTISSHFRTIFGPSSRYQIVTFTNSAQQTEISGVGTFVDIVPEYTRTSQATEYALDNLMMPGEVIGRVDGCLVNVWDVVPDNYLLSIAVSPDIPAPLKMRVDPAVTGLGGGDLQYIDNSGHELHLDRWRARFGMGAGNRLNGHVMEIGNGGSYSVPADYAFD